MSSIPEGRRRSSEATQRAGQAGTYLVAAQLTLEGLVATITSRNAKAVDILAYEPQQKKLFSVQVKTNSEGSSWENDFGVIGVDDIAAPDLFYVFVKLREGDQKHEFYVVPSEEVKRQAKRAKGGWAWFTAREDDVCKPGSFVKTFLGGA